MEDVHIDAFGKICSHYTNFTPQSVLFLQLPFHIKKISKNKPNLQILYNEIEGSDVGHWICTYYDGKVNNIFDSLNSDNLKSDHLIYINRLYGENVENVFHRVQQQTNTYDCGIFAIAFATSICFNKSPVHEKYIINEMRPHVARIFTTKLLIEFPTLQ